MYIRHVVSNESFSKKPGSSSRILTANYEPKAQNSDMALKSCYYTMLYTAIQRRIVMPTNTMLTISPEPPDLYRPRRRAAKYAMAPTIKRKRTCEKESAGYLGQGFIISYTS